MKAQLSLFVPVLVSFFSIGAEAATAKRFSLPLAGEAHLTPTADPCIVLNSETGGGSSPQLGQITWTDQEVVNFCSVPGGISVVSQFTLTMADGSKIFGTFETKGLFNQAGNLEIQGLYRFVSGTAQWANVQGGGTISTTAAAPDANGVSQFGGGTLEGLMFY